MHFQNVGLCYGKPTNIFWWESGSYIYSRRAQGSSRHLCAKCLDLILISFVGSWLYIVFNSKCTLFSCNTKVFCPRTKTVAALIMFCKRKMMRLFLCAIHCLAAAKPRFSVASGVVTVSRRRDTGCVGVLCEISHCGPGERFMWQNLPRKSAERRPIAKVKSWNWGPIFFEKLVVSCFCFWMRVGDGCHSAWLPGNYSRVSSILGIIVLWIGSWEIICE